MNMMTSIGVRRCDVVIGDLVVEFGAVQAQRIIEAEALDFLWEGRVEEHYLGCFCGHELADADDDRDLSRVAIVSVLAGHFYAASCVVDGDGNAVELLWSERIEPQVEARPAHGLAHWMA